MYLSKKIKIKIILFCVEYLSIKIKTNPNVN